MGGTDYSKNTPENSGMYELVSDGSQPAYSFPHGLPGANWVNIQYSDPSAVGGIYGYRIIVDGTNVTIESDTDIPVGSVSVYWEVKKIP